MKNILFDNTCFRGLEEKEKVTFSCEVIRSQFNVNKGNGINQETLVNIVGILDPQIYGQIEDLAVCLKRQ